MANGLTFLLSDPFVPLASKNLTRYFGIFAPAQRYRAAVARMAWQRSVLGQALADPGSRPERNRTSPWAELLRRLLTIDNLKCDQCGGDMKIVAVISASEATEVIPNQLGIDAYQN